VLIPAVGGYLVMQTLLVLSRKRNMPLQLCLRLLRFKGKAVTFLILLSKSSIERKTMKIFKAYLQISKLLCFMATSALLVIQGCGGSQTNKDTANSAITSQPISTGYKVNISATEVGSAIYLNGVYTGAVTPADLSVNTAGEHTIGIGLIDSKLYLKKNITINQSSELQQFSLNLNDLQAAKNWKALFIGVKSAKKPKGNCVSSYTNEELDAGYQFLQWAFEERLEDYSYNTVNWLFDRFDITDEIVTLDKNAVLQPEIIEPYLASHNIKKGDYDFIVPFYRGGDNIGRGVQESGQDCYLGAFQGLGWYDYDILTVQASYVQIRYWDNAILAIAASKEDQYDPGMFIHEWLHSVAESKKEGNTFFETQGYTMPDDGSAGHYVVHAAGAYQYTFPWMTWYQDLISGKVKKGQQYLGITPEAFLACSVREKALDLCPST